jgi:hypothetical protein
MFLYRTSSLETDGTSAKRAGRRSDFSFEQERDIQEGSTPARDHGRVFDARILYSSRASSSRKFTRNHTTKELYIIEK